MDSQRVNRAVFFLREEFLKRNYNVHLFSDSNLILAEKNGKKFFCSGTKTQVQNQMSFWISENKYLTKRVLEYYGLPTAKGVKVSRATIDGVQELQFPVVIKPLNLNGGKDIVIGAVNREKVASYLVEKSQYKEVLVEEMLEGEDTRVLIVRGKFFAAVRRIPAFVVGDGKLTIKELVDQENARRTQLFEQDKRDLTYTNDLDLILFNEDAISTLRESGYSQESVLSSGERVSVRKNANVSTGGISVDCTNEVCLEIREQCELAARCLTMTFAGIDIMTKDLSKPLSLIERSGIVEVNASPGLDLHIFTDEGQRRNPCPLIVDELEEYFSI